MTTGETPDRPPLRVVVCGSKFGQVYLEAFARGRSDLVLAGVLGRGSARTRACADRYGVPVFTDVDQVPADVDAACVVIRGGLLGGPGVQLAQRLMARGIHVLQEHPLHHDELAACLRQARRAGVVYRLNPFYTHTEPVRRFLAAARELLRHQSAQYVDAACGFQVAYALLDIIGSALGRVSPWAFAAAPPVPEPIRALATATAPFRTLDGVIGGTPVTIRVQNQMDPADPDNYAHLLHRVTLGTEGGNLTLVGTHGPVIWSPRPDFPHDVRSEQAAPHFAGPATARTHLDLPSAGVIGPAGTPSYHQIFRQTWPDGVGYALADLRSAIDAGRTR